MAAGRHIEICGNLNNSRTVSPILTKFGTDLRLDTAQIPDGSKRHFEKSKMAADGKTEIYLKLNNFEAVRPICTKFGMFRPLRA